MLRKELTKKQKNIKDYKMEILGIELSKELLVVGGCFLAYVFSLISIADIKR